MTNARLTIDEAQAFLDANTSVQWIDAFVFSWLKHTERSNFERIFGRDRSLHALHKYADLKSVSITIR